MSPKGLVALLVVGLCATQMASATSYRQSRAVQSLLDTANNKLKDVMASSKDAVYSSVETVMAYIRSMETQVLQMGTDKLTSMGIPLDLFTLSELLKTNGNECVTNYDVKTQAHAIIGEVSSCISRDAGSLQRLVLNMQELWATAQTLPESMKSVAAQCSEHAKEDIPEDAMEVPAPEDATDEEVPAPEDATDEEVPAPEDATDVEVPAPEDATDVEVPAPEDATDVEVTPPKDDSDHDLTPVANELMEDAGRTMSKRWLWGFSRITRCVKSVYALTKNDLVTIPGQILAAASDAYRVMNAASGNTKKCVLEKTSSIAPQIQVLAGQVGTCMSKLDLNAIMEANPKLAKLKQMVDVAQSFNKLAPGALGAITNVAANLASNTGAANGGQAASAANLGDLAASLGDAASAANLGDVAALAQKVGENVPSVAGVANLVA